MIPLLQFFNSIIMSSNIREEQQTINRTIDLFKDEGYPLDESTPYYLTNSVTMDSERIKLRDKANTSYKIRCTWGGLRDPRGYPNIPCKPYIHIRLFIRWDGGLEDIERTLSTPEKAIEFFRENRPTDDDERLFVILKRARL